MKSKILTSRNSGLRAVGALVRAKPKLSATLALVCLLVSINHSLGKDDPQPAAEDAAGNTTTTAAIEKFWTIYQGNDFDAIPGVQGQLQAAIQEDPKSPTLYALLGATHFWQVGEHTRDPNLDGNVLLQDMPTAASLFEKSLYLDYYSPHSIGYVNDDHLPGYWGITTVHTGQQLNNPSLIATGDSILDFAVYEFPEFNSFNRWAAHNTDPNDSDTYQKALDSLWNGIDNCIAGKIDRNNPDIRPYLNLVTGVGRKKTCWWKGTLAPYGFEGYFLNLGNGLLKAGQVDAARVIFEDVKYAGNYATWPYRDIFVEIASSDLNARAASYANNDPNNPQQFGIPNRTCVYCHAKVPEKKGDSQSSSRP